MKQQSTDTAFEEVQNDSLSTLDAVSLAILLVLDISEASNTIDHDILTFQLCHFYKYGCIGDTLDWFRSCFTGRIHYIIIELSNIITCTQMLL